MLKKILNDWDLDLDTSMVQVPARQITDVEVMFANRRFSTIQRGDFSRNMNAEGPLQSVDLTNWMIIYNRRNSQNYQLFKLHKTIRQPIPHENQRAY